MIQVFEPEIGEEEIAAVVDALRKGEISGSFGNYLPEFERRFAEFCGAKHGIAVSNGTVALQLAVASLELKPGGEVLMNACTNIATALAAYHNGLVTVPVDSEPDTWNLDLDLLEKQITPQSKVILPVHIYGHPVDMDRVNAIAKKHGLFVIEDGAEAHGAEVRGRRVGALSDMGCFSFYANKIVTTGEGGMVVTNNDALAEKLRTLRNLGFVQPRFYHPFPAFNFRMTGLQAAFGVAQMKKIDRFVEEHRHLAALYDRHLGGIEELQLPVEKDWAKNVYWMYSLVLRKEAGRTRESLLAHLRSRGIDTRTMFCPMNKQPFLQAQAGYRPVDCPVAEGLWDRGFYLPSSNRVTEENVAHIAKSFKEFFAQASR